MMKQISGFTLIELMMTIAIGAILMSVALPSFINLNRSSNITSLSNSMLSSMHMARAEASKRGTQVALCNASTITPPVCGGSNQNWSNGWLVYSLAPGRLNQTYDASQNDVLLSVVEPENNIAIRTNNNASQLIAFNRDGSNASAGMALFGVCDGRGAESGRQIQVTASGRPSVITPGPSNENGVTCTP